MDTPFLSASLLPNAFTSAALNKGISHYGQLVICNDKNPGTEAKGESCEIG